MLIRTLAASTRLEIALARSYSAAHLRRSLDLRHSVRRLLREEHGALSYSTATAVTWTPEGLASGSYDGSTAVDNTSNLYEDVLVGGFVTTGTTPTTAKRIQLFLYGSWDGGTTYSGGATGTDGAYTPGGEAGNLIGPIWVIDTDATTDHRYEWGPVSLGAIIGCVPSKWGLVITHDTVAAFNATAGNFVTKYQGIKY